MSEGFMGGSGDKVLTESTFYSGAFSNPITLTTGFSTKQGEVKIYGTANAEYKWGISANKFYAPAGNVLGTFTVTDNLNGTVTISYSGGGIGAIQIAIVKTLS